MSSVFREHMFFNMCGLAFTVEKYLKKILFCFCVAIPLFFIPNTNISYIMNDGLFLKSSTDISL